MDRALLFKMISEDIKAALRAFERDDFELTNIMGNRVMSDALFGDDSKYALLGFFVKHVGLTYARAKRGLSASRFSDVKWIGRKYLDTFSGFSDEIEHSALWQDFHNFNQEVRKHVRTDIEQEVYEENSEVAHSAFKWLLMYLKEKREVLLDPNSLFLKGILNEMDRIYRVYGGELVDTYMLSLVTGVDRYFDYFQIEHWPRTEQTDRKQAAEPVFSYIQRITDLCLSNEEIEAEDVSKILWELTRDWRQYFIHYMEPPHRTVEKLIELPEESKKKLTDVIGKALEKEIRL